MPSNYHLGLLHSRRHCLHLRTISPMLVAVDLVLVVVMVTLLMDVFAFLPMTSSVIRWPVVSCLILQANGSHSLLRTVLPLVRWSP